MKNASKVEVELRNCRDDNSEEDHIRAMCRRAAKELEEHRTSMAAAIIMIDSAKDKLL